MTVRVPKEFQSRDPQELASIVGLEFITDDTPGVTRRRCGKGFRFLDPSGATITGSQRQQLVDLAVPPAWDDVWLCPTPDGYLCASGFDGAGRKQYRYHEEFRALCEHRKFARLRYFPKALRKLRTFTADALDQPVGTKPHAIAASVRLIDVGLLRVGNERSALAGHFGATTLGPDHFIDDDRIELSYVGKSGKNQRVVIEDDQLIDVLRELADPAEERLFWYVDASDNETRRINAGDINAAILDLVGASFSAKDFRTWGGSREAFVARIEGHDPVGAVDAAAQVLGNTRAVARSAYIHPTILTEPIESLGVHWSRSRSSASFSRGDQALAKFLSAQPVAPFGDQ